MAMKAHTRRDFLRAATTAAVGVSAMINLIGTAPAPEKILAIRGAHLHLYGKESRPGRKLGHITAQAADAEHLKTIIHRLRAVVDF